MLQDSIGVRLRGLTGISSAPLAAALLVISCLGSWVTAAPRADSLARSEADALFRTELMALSTKCDELGVEEQRDLSRAWCVPRDPGRHYVFLPTETDTTKPAANAPRLVKQWHSKFLQVRERQAERLYALANEQARAGDEPAAYRLLHEVLHEDPDHAQARRILGYRRHRQGGWRQPVRKPSRRRNRGPHPRFGWASNQYWQVDSEHFQLTTNLNVRAGRQTCQYLEHVYAVWQQLFYPYWSVAGRLAARFDDEDHSLGPPSVFSVVLFRDRDEYVRQLRDAEPQIEMSVGYYSQEHETAFFYAGDDTTRTTWVHESTHQFFQESGVAAPQVGEKRNFWVVEGVAMYMESLIDYERYATTGGVDADRLQFARFRKLSQQYYVPLDQLVTYGRQQIQTDPNIRQLYSQSAGLTHFLIHGSDGRRMQAFVDYLKTVYRGTGQSQTLESEVAVPYAQLDQDYHQFLNVTDAELAFVDPQVRNLCLGHTEVTDAGLAQLRGCTNLRWLDLSFTPVSDTGFARFKDARELDQLNLERTRISDAALDTVTRFRKLEELDLSHTNVTDRGLEKLSRLTQLRILWLTGTNVTDDGLSALTSLRKLEELDVEQTGVTAAAVDQLRKRLPRLK